MQKKEREAALTLLGLKNIDRRLAPGGEAELLKHGIRPPFPDAADISPGTIVMCTLVSDPLILPDNLVGQCAECREPIQYRPHLFGTQATFCCAPCALRRARGDA